MQLNPLKPVVLQHTTRKQKLLLSGVLAGKILSPDPSSDFILTVTGLLTCTIFGVAFKRCGLSQSPLVGTCKAITHNQLLPVQPVHRPVGLGLLDLLQQMANHLHSNAKITVFTYVWSTTAGDTIGI